MNGDRYWARMTALYGLATFAVFIGFGLLPQVQGVYSAEEAGQAMSAFQRAETPADLAAVFGAPADAGKVAALHAMNVLDLCLFIPAYAFFLVAAACLLAGGFNKPLAWSAIAFALIGAAADAVETTLQLLVTADPENAASHLPIAPWHWAKYGALTGNAIVAAALCFASARRRILLGVVAFVPLSSVAAWAGAAQPPILGMAVGVFWLALLLVALWESVRGDPRAAAARGA